MAPLLSIIIPLYNKQDCILKTLDSVVSQDFFDYEIVIVNDGSTDNSVQMVGIVSNEHIRLFNKENGGPSSARNYGVRMANGAWVLFLDADDTLENGALKLVANNIRKHRLADVFCYSQYIEENHIKQLYPTNHARGYILFPFLKWYLNKIYPGPGRMVVKKTCLEKEPFREDLKRWEDGECIFRLMKKYRFYAVPIPLFTYCRDNIDASKPRKNINEDFCCNLQPQRKSIFEKLAQYKLYQEACELYPEHVEQLYGDTFRKPSIIRAVHLIDLLEKIKNKARSLLRKIKHIIVR